MRRLRRLLGGGHPVPGPSGARDLSGDRLVEWSFCAARLGTLVSPGSRVLDFGSGAGFLSLVAAGLGASVLAVDLVERRLPLDSAAVELRRVDIADLAGVEPFDVIVNCSTVEHVGLAGRYGSRDVPDGDLQAMRRCLDLLAPRGRMLLTLPVGRDAVFAPLHRVYGRRRLPRLLEGYEVLESAFAHKVEAPTWVSCAEGVALDEEGSRSYYAIGMYVLSAAR